MAPIAIYDACVLFPAPLRDLLVRMAAADLVRARWTEEILDECFRSILRQRADLNSDALSRTRRLLTEAVPECIVTQYEQHISSLHLPDTNDRHVLAAAIACRASIIVTANLGDFPYSALERYSVRAYHPDHFVGDIIREKPTEMLRILSQQASALRNPAVSEDGLLERLAACGLTTSVAVLQSLRQAGCV